MATKKKARSWVCAGCKETKSEADVSSSCGQHGGVRCEPCAKNHEREVHEAPAPAARFRDRIKELRRVRAGDLHADPRNWRVHGERQTAGLTAVLEEVGYADALIARETPAGLVLIDGHLRAGIDPEQPVPVLVLDVSEEEAGLLISTLDPLSALADTDAKALAYLLAAYNFEQNAVIAKVWPDYTLDALKQADWTPPAINDTNPLPDGHSVHFSPAEWSEVVGAVKATGATKEAQAFLIMARAYASAT